MPQKQATTHVPDPISIHLELTKQQKTYQPFIA
jgi:hypothetical protein